VTLQPLQRFDLDAAIVFADILVVPQAMGLSLDFREGEGPVLGTVGNAGDVAGLRDGCGSREFAKVCETIGRVRSLLAPEKTLIGFCGAPWTVASYMIEGGSSGRLKAQQIAMANPAWFADLLRRLVDVSCLYLSEQVKAGAEVVQIFDSWAGDIPAGARDRCVIDPLAYMCDFMRREHPEVPVIVFARGVGDGHGEVARRTGAHAVSVESGVELAEVLKQLPAGCCVQGNLDPQALLGEDRPLVNQIHNIIDRVPVGRHVFNLGHGIVPQTRPETIERLISVIRQHDGEV
jgi:uroporphyrinogen decarboxylase